MASKFSINISEDERDRLVKTYPEGLTHAIRVAIEVLHRYENGELIPATEKAIGKSEDELKKEKLAVDIEIKKQIRDMGELARKNAQADLDLKLERIRKLQRENDRAEGAPFPMPKPSPVTTAIETDLKKDTVTPQPEPRKRPSFVHELPAGQGLVGCDSCHEVFIFDNADNGLDEFLDHLKQAHPWRHEQVSTNEANQFRRARDRIAKGVPAS